MAAEFKLYSDVIYSQFLFFTHLFCCDKYIFMADEFEQKAKEFDISGAVATSVITALSFTVGLFWKDVITKTINEVLPPGETLFYEYLAAIIVTILAVIASFFILKTAEQTRKLQRKHERKFKSGAKKIGKRAVTASNKRKRKFIKRFRGR